MAGGNIQPSEAFIAGIEAGRGRCLTRKASSLWPVPRLKSARSILRPAPASWVVAYRNGKIYVQSPGNSLRRCDAQDGIVASPLFNV